MRQTIITFITKIDPNKKADLGLLLDEIAANLKWNQHLPFASLDMLHFASLVIFDNDETYGPYLVFESNFDGSLESYLEALFKHARVGIHRIYSHCLDYHTSGPDDRSMMLDFLKSHIVRPKAFHIGNVGRCVSRIHQEAELRYRLETLLDGIDHDGTASVSPDSLRREIQGFVRENAAWAITVPPRQTLIERIAPWARIIALLLIVIAATILALPVVILVVAVWLIILRRHEKRDAFHPISPSHAQLKELLEREDRIIQNHFANINRVKPGSFRRVTLRVVLWLANLLARTQTKGTLAGIQSIHFAHWSLIDNGERLLFLSNYDGDWESYLDEFIDKASNALTGIWSNTVDFLPTRFLIRDGSRDAKHFKELVRSKQTFARVWYSAYPNLTVQNIDNNSAIREDIFTTLDETAVRHWLWRF